MKALTPLLNNILRKKVQNGKTFSHLLLSGFTYLTLLTTTLHCGSNDNICYSGHIKNLAVVDDDDNALFNWVKVSIGDYYSLIRNLVMPLVNGEEIK